MESEKLSEIGGKCETEGMHHCLRGWTSLGDCTLVAGSVRLSLTDDEAITKS